MENTKKCPKCQSDIPLGAIKCPQCHSDIRRWWRRHPVLSLLLILIIGGPLLSGMLSGLKKTDAPSVKNDTVSTPTLTLTERLEKINNDPYWTSTTQADYSSNTKLQVQSVLFSSYANDVLEGEKSSSDKDKQLASEIKKKLIAKQIAEYPKMRKAYAELAGKILWEKDIEVTPSGSSYTTLTFVGTAFVTNKNVGEVQGSIEDMLKELRFKRVVYRWMREGGDYVPYDLKTPADGDLTPLSF